MGLLQTSQVSHLETRMGTLGSLTRAFRPTTLFIDQVKPGWSLDQQRLDTKVQRTQGSEVFRQRWLVASEPECRCQDFVLHPVVLNDDGRQPFVLGRCHGARSLLRAAHRSCAFSDRRMILRRVLKLSIRTLHPPHQSPFLGPSTVAI